MAQRLRTSKTEKAGQPSPSSEKLQTDWKALKQDYHAKMRQARLNKMLIEAATYGKTKAVKRLLNLGANVEATDHDYTAALIWAARCGHTDICKILIENGAGIETTDICRRNPLMHAADFGQTDVCALLIEKGASMEAKDIYGWTALMHAISNGKTDVCSLLIEKGAIMHWRDKKGKAPFYAPQVNERKIEAFLKLMEKAQALTGKDNFRIFYPSFRACVGTGV